MMKRREVPRTLVTKNVRETRRFAREAAGEFVLRFPPRGKLSGAFVLSLTGNLGSGKTTFSQSFAKALGVKETVNSPTFVLEKTYKLKLKSFDYLAHIDAYRLDTPEDLTHLGWRELVKNNRLVILIEWGDLIKSILPKDYIEIKFEHAGVDKRKIKIIKHLGSN